MRIMTAIVATLLVAAPAIAAQPIAGRWITEDRAAEVEIGRCGTNLCGRIIRIVTPTPGAPTTDVSNPDPAQRNKPILGLTILTGFTDDGDDWRGRIYDPRKGKTYKSILTRQPNGTLKVQGCIAFFCQTQVWTRAN
ncbi:MAG: DUF2147 domain-containing protein [Sphingomonas sp.]|nr:MAG: DUF2147 domain-containing protein [Sphingomonas sp.]